MAVRLNLVGNKYGHLEVMEYAGSENGRTTWLCKCDCGNSYVATQRYLHSGIGQNCGCIKKKLNGKTPDDNCVCEVCGKRFHIKPYRLGKYKHHYCSLDCHKEAKKQYMKGELNHQYGLRGENNASWKGGRVISNYGYMETYAPDHPFHCRDKRVFEHRLVAEKYLLTPENSVVIDGKRYLSPDYVVHHKNGNRLDNRPENLEVLSLSEHTSLHNRNTVINRDSLGRFAVGKRTQNPEGDPLP